MRDWAARYPDAADQLGQWVETRPAAARQMGEWQRLNPEKMDALVDWSITHVHESLNAFLLERVGWGELERIADANPGAIEDLMAWIRRAPPAASELKAHTAGLDFAAEHAASWRR